MSRPKIGSIVMIKNNNQYLSLYKNQCALILCERQDYYLDVRTSFMRETPWGKLTGLFESKLLKVVNEV